MLSYLLILGLGVKTVKGHYYIGTENLTLVSTNDQVMDITGMEDINSVALEEITTLPGIGVKTVEKNINTWNDLRRNYALDEIMLVLGIGRIT